MEAVEEASWLVVGLGNPGSEYAGTRHNLGFAVVERLAAENGGAFRSRDFECEAAVVRLAGKRLLLIKPQSFMNRSGAAVAAWLERIGLTATELLVVHDDLDLPLGRIRIVAAGGAGGHRGICSIQEQLGTKAFPRIRVGIGRPQPGERAADRVLGRFSTDEAALAAAVVERCAAALECLVREGIGSAMNRYNSRDVLDVSADASPRGGEGGSGGTGKAR